MIRCLNCGTTNDDNNKFCSKCGNSLAYANAMDTQQNNSSNNDPRRIDEYQHVSNQQQGMNDPRRIDENFHRSNQQQTNNDPRRMDERKHVPNQTKVNNQQQRVNTRPQINNQQQGYNQNTNNNDSILNKISNLSTPVKIISVIICCCIGLLIVSALGGGMSDQGSLPTSNNYNDNSYGDVFDSFSKSSCREINFKELDKNPDKYIGENIKIKGKVMQISEGNSDGNYLLMYVNGNYDQLAYVEYYDNTNIVEDDYITVYGVCGGSYSYTTTIGGTNTVPSVYGAILE